MCGEGRSVEEEWKKMWAYVEIEGWVAEDVESVRRRAKGSSDVGVSGGWDEKGQLRVDETRR